MGPQEARSPADSSQVLPETLECRPLPGFPLRNACVPVRTQYWDRVSNPTAGSSQKPTKALSSLCFHDRTRLSKKPARYLNRVSSWIDRRKWKVHLSRKQTVALHDEESP